VKNKIILAFFCLAGFISLSAQDDPGDLLLQIQEAVDADFFDKALDLLDQGLREYPGDFRFPMARGDLYKSRELYSLAMNSFGDAESLNPGDSILRENVASTLGYLDRNFEALEYLEDLYEELNEALQDDMGWMYYKTHQPEKGIVLIEAALEKEFDRNLSLTLGTLYSEMNEPESCRLYYLEAIHDALEEQDSYFASVGYYNLSLAEKSFYDYDAAAEYASLSLELMNRSGGHLALGDLNMLRQNYSRAEEEFLEAIELDETPLSRSNLVALYLNRGFLSLALQQLKKIAESKDESWLYYYCLYRQQFTLDLYQQYHQLYRGLFFQTSLLREWGVKKKVSRFLERVSYLIKSKYYKIKYRTMAFKEGQSQLKGGSVLRGNLTLAAATEGFSSLSEKYYNKAYSLEVFPEAAPWYNLELGREQGDRTRLNQAALQFDQVWEAEPREEALREMALLLKRRDSQQKDLLLLEVYSRNPGGLLQYGLRLPLSLRLSGTKVGPAQTRKIRRLLKGSGFLLRSEASGNFQEALILRINMAEVFSYSLTNAEGAVITSGAVSEDPKSAGVLEDWARSFRMQVFFP
jgi:tetratricopeptide (TPR) repeat protein